MTHGGLVTPTGFLSTPSARRATQIITVWEWIRKFLSTPSARRATQDRGQVRDDLPISIHALREEGDHHHRRGDARAPEISIHALREEGDGQGTVDIAQATPISIHALREEGDGGTERSKEKSKDFYPRPPRGGRPITKPCSSKLFVFLSTPSARRATRLFYGLSQPFYISIHALREEGDF